LKLLNAKKNASPTTLS